MRSKLHLILVAMIVISPSAFAGINRWTSNGPQGGSVNALVVDPADDATVYATTNRGVYKSENSGTLWKPMTNGMSDLSVSALTISPEDHAALYAGTSRGAVFKTVDGGQHWSELSRPTDGSIRAFAMSRDVIHAGTARGLFRSRDGGRTWEPSTIGSSSYIFFVVLSPDGVLFVKTSGAIYVSHNSGETWDQVKTVSPQGTAMTFGADGSIYLAGRDGIVRSVDGGKSWQFLTAAPKPFIYVNALQISSTGRFYLGSSDGLFESQDRERWIIPEGASGLSGINTIVIGSTTGRLYAGTRDIGVFTKIENSTDWTAANQGIDAAATSDVAVPPFDPSTVYAATQTGVFKSDDKGESWKKIDPKAARAVAVDPFDANVVFAGGPQLRKSVDGGATWKLVATDFASTVAVAPSDSATLYAALARGMAKSGDGGETWTMAMDGMPLSYYASYYGFTGSIAVDPSNSSTVYVGQELGLFKTTTGGKKWDSISSSMRTIQAIAIDPSDSAVVYVGSLPASFFGILGGVSKSIDGGATFAPVGLSGHTISTMVINPADPSVVYAGSWAGDVYRSESGGAEWHLFSDGLPRAAIRRLAIDSSGHYLYAATEGGLFAYLISQIDIDSLTDDSLRLPRLLNELLAGDRSARSGFVLPITGLTSGANGTFFKTDLTLRNDRDTDQEVLIAWLAQGNTNGRVPFFRVTLHPSSAQEVNIPNIVDRLGFSGLGSLVVLAVDSSENLDSRASIDGSSRICAQSPDQRPVCQSIGGVRADVFAGHGSARAAGLQYDARIRTNVGIVNLDSIGHQFVITAAGERHLETFGMFVPPFSLAQIPIPDHDYGPLTLTAATDSGSPAWILYGSSIDDLSGAAVTAVGRP